MGDIHVMREEFLPPKPPPRRHLISVGDLTRDDVERLLATARSFSRSLEREVMKLPTLRGRTVINMFFESSTRTASSFELAAKRLSADTMTVRSAGSSMDKGESLKDTALTLAAFDPDVIVIRHEQIGAPQRTSACTFERATRECRTSPTIATWRPSSRPSSSRSVYRSSSACVGCWCLPSPALTT